MAHPLPPLNKTVAELAALVNGRLEGDPRFVVALPATLAEAGPNDIAFFANPKYSEAAAASGAGCLLLPQSQAGLACRSPNRIFVSDPQLAFSQVLWLLEEVMPELPGSIDAKAAVHPQASLGAGVGVGAFTVIESGAVVEDGARIAAQCYIGENARIGRQCRIYPQVIIRENCVIGERVIIHPGTVIGADGFGFTTDRNTGRHKKIPQLGNVVVGDDAEIGSNVTIDRAMVGSTTIGRGTQIDNLVMIAHGVKVGRDCILVSQVGIAGSCQLGDRVILGGQVGLAGHLKLGDGVQVGAQSGLMADVPAGTVMFGYPARPHREAFKLQALYGRLPEMRDALKAIQKKLGIGAKVEIKTES